MRWASILFVTFWTHLRQTQTPLLAAGPVHVLADHMAITSAPNWEAHLLIFGAKGATFATKGCNKSRNPKYLTPRMNDWNTKGLKLRWTMKCYNFVIFAQVHPSFLEQKFRKMPKNLGVLSHPQLKHTFVKNTSKPPMRTFGTWLFLIETTWYSDIPCVFFPRKPNPNSNY